MTRQSPPADWAETCPRCGEEGTLLPWKWRGDWYRCPSGHGWTVSPGPDNQLKAWA